MDDLDTFIALFAVVMAPLFFGGIIGLLWFYFKINQTLFREHHELWENLGCPGAGMWFGVWIIPGRRGIWKDNKATNQFWKDKWFRLKAEYYRLFPEDVLLLFRRFHRVSRFMAVLVIADWLFFIAVMLSELS